MNTYDLIISKPLIIALIVFISAIIGIGFMIIFDYSTNNRRHKNIGIYFITQAFVIGVLWMLLSFIFTQIVRKKFIKFLENKEGLVLQINNVEIKDIKKQNLLFELENMDNFTFNHDSPTTKIVLTLKSKEKTYFLDLYRANNSKESYWIFITNYKQTTNDAIGKMLTKNFDEY